MKERVKLIVYFLPSRNGKIKLNYSFASKFKSGDLFITDNQNIPFGGFIQITGNVKKTINNKY